MHWRDLRSTLADSFIGWSKHKAPRLGASLSFYTLLSIAPLLLIVAWAIGFFIGPAQAQADVIEQIQVLVGSQGAAAARFLLQGSRNTAHGIVATALGLLALMIGASGVMIELRDALNIIWDVATPDLSGLKEIFGFLKERLFSFALVIAAGLVLLVSLAFSTLLTALSALSSSAAPAHAASLHILTSLGSFAVMTGLLAAVYRFVPDTRIEWRVVLLGAAVTSFLITVGKLGIGIYLGKSTFASMYGAASSIVLFIIWVYYSAQIFFFGAEFTKMFSLRFGSQRRNTGNRDPNPAA